MLNPIPKSDFFATDTIRNLLLRIEEIPNKKERAVAYIYAMQMLNACHQAVADEIVYNELRIDELTTA
jgi:hypothetical protein